MELSIIIVNYNGLNHLKNCFDSIAEKLTGISHEIIVIDNDSKDGSDQYIRENYPEVVLIASKVNLGFGKGNNLGVKYAKGEYLLLLNNDTIILSNLHSVLELLKNDERIGVIGINMLNAEKQYLQVTGHFPNPRNMFQLKKLLTQGKEFKSGNFSKDYYEVDWIGGSFIMIKKELYMRVGGFDEDYFMYVEDVDFCKKVANLGYKRVFLPKFSYIHFVGFNSFKNKFIIKGYEIYLSKHYKGMYKYLCQIAININKLVKTIKSI